MIGHRTGGVAPLGLGPHLNETHGSLGSQGFPPLAINEGPVGAKGCYTLPGRVPPDQPFSRNAAICYRVKLSRNAAISQ